MRRSGSTCAGFWGFAALRLLILVAAWVVCYLSCLVPEGPIAGSTACRFLENSAVLYDAGFRPFSARLLTYLRRDHDGRR